MDVRDSSSLVIASYDLQGHCSAEPYCVSLTHPEMHRPTQYFALATRFARKIFAIEHLSNLEPRSGRRRSSVLRLLFAPEPLPRDPLRPAPRRSPWLRWLFAPERIDDK